MTTKNRIIHCELGRITITTDLNSFLTAPLEQLQRARVYGNIRWEGCGTSSLISSEKVAERIADFIKDRFPENYLEDGLKPLRGIHGLGFYQRYISLRLSGGQEKHIAKALAEYLNQPLEKIENWFVHCSSESIHGVFMEDL